MVMLESILKFIKQKNIGDPDNFFSIKLKIREYFEKYSISIGPVNFYSGIPSIEEINSSFEYRDSLPPYDLSTIFDGDFLREELKNLIPYSSKFQSSNVQSIGDKNICTEFKFSFNNTQFTGTDAIAYFSYITKVQPKKIIEIGSGFSTLVAIEARYFLKSDVSVVCIEPYPRNFIKDLKSSSEIILIKKKLQEITLNEFDAMLSDGDLLFIDSTHAVKTGSDVLYLYLKILPFIRKKIFIHIHDIFLPYGMPKEWLLNAQRYWTEQYLVMAWILDNHRIRVLFGSSFHEKNNPDLLEQLSNGRHSYLGGGSLWLEYN